MTEVFARYYVLVFLSYRRIALRLELSDIKFLV